MLRRLFFIPVLLLAVLALVAALWSGLIRLGWPWPAPWPGFTLQHGPLMVGGFFGTLIGLERAAAIRRWWAYLGPVFSGLGGLLLLVGLPAQLAGILITLGSLGLVVVFAGILRRHFAGYTAAMALGALIWLVGNVLWLAGWPVFRITAAWMGFFILTIAGERLELGRIRRLPARAATVFWVVSGLFLSGVVLGWTDYPQGMRLVGLGLLGLALWHLQWDIARKTVHQVGLPRYIAWCLLTGFGWLGIGGLIALAYGGLAAGPPYDAFLHSIFLGFVFGMVFGHAPIIFPALLDLQLVYYPVFYVPLVLLQVSLALRVWGGLAGMVWARQWGGAFNALAVVSFFGLFVLLTVVERAKTRPLKVD